MIEGDSALIDPTVLESSIIYPNDVQLIHKAFRKMRSFAKLHGIPVWWDEALLKKMWREFGLSKGKDRVKRLAEFGILFFAAPETFRILAESLNASARQKPKARKLVKLLELLKKTDSAETRGRAAHKRQDCFPR